MLLGDVTCLECGLYPGEYEDTGNGLWVVYCDDARVRCVRENEHCPYWEKDFFAGMTEID